MRIIRLPFEATKNQSFIANIVIGSLALTVAYLALPLFKEWQEGQNLSLQLFKAHEQIPSSEYINLALEVISRGNPSLAGGCPVYSGVYTDTDGVMCSKRKELQEISNSFYRPFLEDLARVLRLETYLPFEPGEKMVRDAQGVKRKNEMGKRMFEAMAEEYFPNCKPDSLIRRFNSNDDNVLGKFTSRSFETVSWNKEKILTQVGVLEVKVDDDFYLQQGLWNPYVLAIHEFRHLLECPNSPSLLGELMPSIMEMVLTENRIFKEFYNVTEGQTVRHGAAFQLHCTSKMIHSWGSLADTISNLQKKHTSLASALTSHEFISYLTGLPVSFLEKIHLDKEAVAIVYNHLESVKQLLQQTDLFSSSTKIDAEVLKRALRSRSVNC
jgi:hypothetical protein